MSFAGRARAKNAISVFLCLDRTVADTEYEAIVAERTMIECLKRIHENGPPALAKQVRDKMARDAAERESVKRDQAKKIEDLKHKE